MPSRPPADRRQFGRRQSTLHGWLIVEGRPRIPCIVRNVSDGGALVECPVPKNLPFRFHVEIEAKDFRALCEPRHQRDNWVGVRFIQIECTSAPIDQWQPLE